MTRLSYTLKCWALGLAFFIAFYALVLTSDPSFDKYTYLLGLSTLLFPVAKHGVNVLIDFFDSDLELSNSLLSSLVINIVIWLFTPFIAAMMVMAFVFYSMGVLTESISH